MRRKVGGKTLLVFTQPFLPDPASVGQHMADAAFELARRGHRVVVITSDRGYDDPGRRYPRRETMLGVEVKRVPFTSFGKSRGSLRVFGAVVFMLRCLADGIFRRNLAGILFHTSPPFIGVIAILIGKVRGCPTIYWAMDMNPDQLIALGKISPNGMAARYLAAAHHFIVRGATLIVALDRFMRDKLSRSGNAGDKTVVIPPWPHEESQDASPPAPNSFRARHGLDGKVVVMYSGNHTPSNPLTTLLDAAVHFRNEPRVAFVFVGGGIGKKQVEDYATRHSLSNVYSLPYQPLSELQTSLSAADVHVVSLGAGMTGVIHPCKVYGAMSAGRPILYLGPTPSHVADLLQHHDIGWHVAHGDVAGAIRTIEKVISLQPAALAAKGRTAQNLIKQQLDQSRLRGRFCDEVERALFGRSSALSPAPEAGAVSP